MPKLNLENSTLYLLTAIAFLLPLNQKIIIYLITLLGILSVVSWIKFGVQKLERNYWPFIILFAFYGIGLIFTTNFDYGLKDIETRSTFLLLPLFIGLTKRKARINLGPIFIALIIGSIIQIGLCYYYSFECYEQVGYIECFEGSRLSYHMHPTYFALYLIIAGTFGLIWHAENRKSKIGLALMIVVILLFGFMVYRLYSLGPWVSLVCMIGFLVFAFSYFQNRLKLFLIAMLGMTVIGVFAANTFAFIKKDVNEVREELTLYFENPKLYFDENKDDPHSINARIIIWNTSFNFIKEHPFGVGTGDMKDELMARYCLLEMDAFAEKELNPHSQYLQTAVSIGIVSSLFLIFIFCYYLYIGFKYRSYYLIALVSLFVMICFFESVLERQWGILFFLFFLTIIIQDINAKKTTQGLNVNADK